jgi:hypothetical protein
MKRQVCCKQQGCELIAPPHTNDQSHCARALPATSHAILYSVRAFLQDERNLGKLYLTAVRSTTKEADLPAVVHSDTKAIIRDTIATNAVLLY